MDTVLLERFRKALPAAKGWCVADYREEFEWLWEIRSNGEDQHSLSTWLKAGEGAEKNILIIWDGMPPNLDQPPVNITDHLTPMDWAVSLSRRLLSEASRPQLRIFILDCNSHHLPNAYGCRMTDTLMAALHWVSVIRLLPSHGGPRRSLANQCNAGFLKQALESTQGFPALNDMDGHSAEQGLNTLVHGWIGNLTHSATHHDVNNLLGPMVLSSAFTPKIIDPGTGCRALLKHAQWLQLAPSIDAKPGSDAYKPWLDATELADKLRTTLRVVLVDDQTNNGWHRVIAAALGLPYKSVISAKENIFTEVVSKGKVELWATTGYMPLIERLDEEIMNVEKQGKKDARFNLSLTPMGDGRRAPAEVLMLDLRLTSSRDDDVCYFRKVLDLAKKVHSKYPNGAGPWGVLLNDIEILDHWLQSYRDTENVEKFRSSEEYLEFITLLPRIIATLDLSLPIVVFSSSGQRHVLESLRDFGNIITILEKPRFIGYRAEEVVTDVMSKFRKAIDQVMDLLIARLELQRVIESGRSVSPVESDTGYVEVYIDESGSEDNDYFSIGGLMLFFSDKRQADDIDSSSRNVRVEIEGKAYQLCWYGKNDCLPKRLGFKPKPSARLANKTIIPSLAEFYKEKGVTAIPFILRTSTEDVVDSTDLLSNDHQDNLFYRIVPATLEVLLFEVIPLYMRSNNKPLIRIYAGTRARVKGKSGERYNKDERNALLAKWGIVIERSGDHFKSIRPDSIAPIVAKVLHDRQNAPRPHLVGARGVPINVKDKRKAPGMEHAVPECPSLIDYIMEPARQLVGYAKYECGEGRTLAIGRKMLNGFMPEVFGWEIYENYMQKSYSDLKDEPARNSHLAADVVVNVANLLWGEDGQNPMQGHFTIRLGDEIGRSGFDEAMDASRCIDAGDLPAGLLRSVVSMRKFRAWVQKHSSYEDDSAVPRILYKVVRELDAIDGDEYLVYLRGLRDWVATESTPGNLPRRTKLKAASAVISCKPPWKSCGPLDKKDWTLVLGGFGTEVSKEHVQGAVCAYLGDNDVKYIKLQARRSKYDKKKVTCWVEVDADNEMKISSITKQWL